MTDRGNCYNVSIRCLRFQSINLVRVEGLCPKVFDRYSRFFNVIILYDIYTKCIGIQVTEDFEF